MPLLSFLSLVCLLAVGETQHAGYQPSAPAARSQSRTKYEGLARQSCRVCSVVLALEVRSPGRCNRDHNTNQRGEETVDRQTRSKLIPLRHTSVSRSYVLYDR